MEKVNVGIVGAAGYTAGELLRVLLLHGQAHVSWVQSDSQAGKTVSEVHPDLVGEMDDLAFVRTIPSNEADVIFLCKGHGESVRIMSDTDFSRDVKIVDLSQDFRLQGPHDFVYGLPEFNYQKILKSSRVANPGCFATAIQLGILPAVEAGIVNSDIHMSGVTGSTGAGQQLSPTSHFSWRNNNISVYKPFSHQHLAEVGETLQQVDPGFDHLLNFIPYRGNFSRGIIITAYFNSGVTQKDLEELYCETYREAPFTIVTNRNPDLKMVVNTNKCLVYPTKIGGRVMVISVIDNLIKGASGQAIQNMNLMCGFDEAAGLQLKAIAF